MTEAVATELVAVRPERQRPSRYRLLPGTRPRVVQLTDEQRSVVRNTRGRLKVLAGPGTGKTTTLVETVAERVLSGACRPAEILILTYSRRAAAELSGRIASRIALTTAEPMVRTIHSYALRLVREQAMRLGQRPPRLLHAGESDAMVRDLLEGQVQRGDDGWPAELRGALLSPAFAAELRNLLLRTAERGVEPVELIRLGRRHHRPEWIAAGAFAREFHQVSDLRQASSGLGVALDHAELTVAALAVLADETLLGQEQARLRRIYVDEYQDVDAAQARLVRRIADGADELVVVGDPDQAIYGFRGSDPAALRDIEVDRVVALTASRRMGGRLIEATRRVAAQLPGPARHRALSPVGSMAADTAPVVAVLGGPSREAAFVADQLRRAHLLDGVAWSSMAVLVRSPARSFAPLTRALSAAGIPVVVGSGGRPPCAEPLVQAIVTVLRCGVDPNALTGEVALDLLASPLAGIDALALRRLRRALRVARYGAGTSADALAALLSGAIDIGVLPDDVQVAVRTLAEMIAMAGAHAADPTAEQVLWLLWQRSQAEPGLLSAAERGGRAGQRADQVLDAVTGLFGVATELAERLPLAGVRALLDLVEDQQVADDTDSITRVGEAVRMLSAHAAKGLEWDVVAVVGVQEGTWPDLRPPGNLLHAVELLDRAAGMPKTVSGVAERLAEERRLFYVACTRARRTLICTAVADPDHVPSRFLSELAGIDDDLPVQPAGGLAVRRALHPVDLVADLRRVVTDPATPPRTAELAAHQLARLAAAHVPGAHPSQWYGLPDVTTDRPLVAAGRPVTLSPSLVESLLRCPLRAMLDRRRGAAAPTAAQIEGIVVHALAAALGAGLDDYQLRTEIDAFLAADQNLPAWQRERARRVLRRMLEAARSWIRATHPPRQRIGSEVGVDVTIPGGPDAPHPVRVTGRIDWLSRAADGSLVVSDFKTGASVSTKADAAADAQLAIYQLAAGTPAPGGREPGRPGGAELVFLRSGEPKILTQPPLAEPDRAALLGILATLAGTVASSRADAVAGAGCERCPVRQSCPVQPAGQQVTR